MFNFHTFKGFLIFTELDKLGKFGRKFRQISLICQLSLSFKKTQMTIPTPHVGSSALIHQLSFSEFLAD